MTWLLLLWLGLLVALLALAVGRRHDGGALTLAYFLGLSLIHVPGGLPYLNPDWSLFGQEATEVGFEVTLIGLAAFVIGAIWVQQTVRSDQKRAAHSVSPESLNAQGWRLIAIGSIAYFVLLPASSLVASSTSLVLALSTTLVIGLWLRLYSAIQTNDRRSTLMTLCLLPLLPLATTVTGGFIGYGASWVISVVAFLFVISRRRRVFYLGAPLAVFLALSLFVTYMGERNALREIVWNQQAGYGDRLERVGELVTNFKFLDLADPAHRLALDSRLNQNYYVGSGVMLHRSGHVDLAYGATLQLWALVPRALWPEKPVVGGGGSVITDFTGIPVAEGTSFGAGQVLESYYNFGLPGVIAIFLMLGALLRWLDVIIMRALATGDKRQLLLAGMPGLTLLQPNGNALEIFVGVISALVVAQLLWLFDRRRSRKQARLAAVQAASRRVPMSQRSSRLLNRDTLTNSR